MYSLHSRICNLSMASFSFRQRSHSRQPNSTPSALNYYTFKSRHLPLSPTPSQCLSNEALDLQLSYVLCFVYCDRCRTLGSCDDAEGLGTLMISWGIWEFQVSSLQRFRLSWRSFYMSPTTTFSLTDTSYLGSSPKRIIRQWV